MPTKNWTMSKVMRSIIGLLRIVPTDKQNYAHNHCQNNYSLEPPKNLSVNTTIAKPSWLTGTAVEVLQACPKTNK